MFKNVADQTCAPVKWEALATNRMHITPKKKSQTLSPSFLERPHRPNTPVPKKRPYLQHGCAEAKHRHFPQKKAYESNGDWE